MFLAYSRIDHISPIEDQEAISIMSPAAKLDRSAINGPRPSPLKLHKESHVIHNQRPCSPFLMKQKQKKPVIIYMQSPKVIHAQARDFMALVQKLTGITKRTDEECSSSRIENGVHCLADIPLFTPNSVALNWCTSVLDPSNQTL